MRSTIRHISSRFKRPTSQPPPWMSLRRTATTAVGRRSSSTENRDISAPSMVTPSDPGTLTVGRPRLLDTVGRPSSSSSVSSRYSGNSSTKFLRMRSCCHGCRPVCCRSADTALRILTLLVTYCSICSAARRATFRFPWITASCAPVRSEKMETAPYASSGSTAAAAMSNANRVEILEIFTARWRAVQRPPIAICCRADLCRRSETTRKSRRTARDRSFQARKIAGGSSSSTRCRLRVADRTAASLIEVRSTPNRRSASGFSYPNTLKPLHVPRRSPRSDKRARRTARSACRSASPRTGRPAHACRTPRSARPRTACPRQCCRAVFERAVPRARSG